MKTNTAQKRTVVIGSGSIVRELLREIDARPQCGYHIIGLVAEAGRDVDSAGSHPVLGTLENLHRIIQSERPQVIIVAFSRNSITQPEHQLMEARVCKRIRIEQAEAVFEAITGKVPIQTLAPSGVIYEDGFHPGRLALLSTRLLSLCCALAGLIVFAPVLALIALGIRLDSPGPVLFIQQRIGYGGKSFRLLKFRTMRPATERTSEWEGDNVHRITGIGRWLRKYRLDELPQFFNILKGDMNLVGPRPHPASSFELFVLVSRNMPESGIQIPFYSLRYSVMPGITGWAQVRYQYANSIDQEIEKLRFDLYYIKHYSLWFDLRIIAETVRIVLMGHGTASKVPVKPRAAVEEPAIPEVSYTARTGITP